MRNLTIVGLIAVAALVVQNSSEAQTNQPTTFTRVFAESTPNLVAPALIAQVPPVYPAEAIRQNVSGTVAMDVTVGVDGRPTDAMVVRAPNPSYGLDDAAVRAVSGWTFKPGSLDGKPVPVRVQIELAMEWVRR